MTSPRICSGHASGIQTCDQPPFDRKAHGADERAADGAEAQRALDRHQQRHGLDERRFDDVQREVRDAASEPAYRDRQQAAHRQVEEHRAESCAGAEPHPRGHERDARGEHDQDRVVDELELRYSEVELELERRQADEQAAGPRDVAQALDPDRLAVRQAAALHSAPDLDLDHGDREQRHRRAADEHEVRRAPERDVLPEQPVPHVVEREADQREAAGGAHEDATERGMPLAADPDRGRSRAVGALLARQADREEAGGEDPVQAGEDEPVGRVVQRPAVTADVDVDRDVPVQPEDRGDERHDRQPAGHRSPCRLTGDALREALEPAERGDQLAAVPEAAHEQEDQRERGDERGGADGFGRRPAGGVRRSEESQAHKTPPYYVTSVGIK